MSYRVDMSSPDIDKQIELLKFYPEVMEKHFRPVLVTDVSKLYSKIRSTIPRRTGRALSKFKRSVRGKGINLEGRVGWWGKDQPWYINVLEYGAKPHVIRSKKEGGFLWFGGRFVQVVHHPGLSKRGFMQAGFDDLKPMVDADMLKASNAVVNEMAVK